MSSPNDIFNDLEDINMDHPKGRSNKSSITPSRESSIDFKSSIKDYAHQMEIQSEDPNWANQADTEILLCSTSFSS